MTGKTTRERYLAGETACDKDERQRFAEYAIRPASDADLAYARQERILHGLPADELGEAA